MDIFELDATSMAKLVNDKKIKVIEVVDKIYDRISKQKESLNSYIYVDYEGAKRKAYKIQELVDNGKKLRLAGVVFSVKDNICVKEMPLTCGSKLLADYVSDYTATVVRRLEDEGAIVIGKTNMDEFAMGSDSTTSFTGPVHNPHNLECIAGGSSGGSAASLAAGECFFSLGSDTGGSIRQPASHCGVYGYKPTYGTFSRFGLVAYASSLEQIGIVAKSVRDVKLLCDIMSGFDEADSRSCKNTIKPVKKQRYTIAIDSNIYTYIEDKEILKVFNDKLDEYSKSNDIVECNLKLTKYLTADYYTIAMAEASSNLSRFDTIRYGHRSNKYSDIDGLYTLSRSEGFGKEVRKRILTGTYILSNDCYEDYYLKALKVRRKIYEEYKSVFDNADMLMSPVTVGLPTRIGDSIEDIKQYSDDVFTVGANLCGMPAMVYKGGMTEAGIPIGIQMMADRYMDNYLFDWR